MFLTTRNFSIDKRKFKCNKVKKLSKNPRVLNLNQKDIDTAIYKVKKIYFLLSKLHH